MLLDACNIKNQSYVLKTESIYTHKYICESKVTHNRIFTDRLTPELIDPRPQQYHQETRCNLRTDFPYVPVAIKPYLFSILYFCSIEENKTDPQLQINQDNLGGRPPQPIVIIQNTLLNGIMQHYGKGYEITILDIEESKLTYRVQVYPSTSVEEIVVRKLVQHISFICSQTC